MDSRLTPRPTQNVTEAEGGPLEGYTPHSFLLVHVTAEEADQIAQGIWEARNPGFRGGG